MLQKQNLVARANGTQRCSSASQYPRWNKSNVICFLPTLIFDEANNLENYIKVNKERYGSSA